MKYKKTSRKHIDDKKTSERMSRLDKLDEILDHQDEDEFIAALKEWGVRVTQQLLNEFRKRRDEKRGFV